MSEHVEPSTEQWRDAVRESSAVIIDLDETLWLRNSTEEYLNSIRPRWLVAAVLVVMRVLPVWRLFGSQEDAEDWLRVVVCTVVFPWALPSWSRTSRSVGPRWLNQPLAEAAAESAGNGSAVLIATRGFRPIVEPLVRSFDLPAASLLACRFWKGRDDRRTGKLAMLDEQFGPQFTDAATVITDSETDRPLLDRCAVPVLRQWPDAEYVPAPLTYAPFAYAEMYKRAGQRYVLNEVLMKDTALWAITTATVAAGPLWQHLVGVALLAASFWCVYDVGYVENDRVAERHEPDPVLPDRPLPARSYTLSAWVWSLLSGSAAVYLLRPGEFLRVGLLWLGLLVGLRLTYFVYNHVDKGSRTLLYGALQALRLLAPLVVVPVPLAGVIALVALGWSRSLLYLLYRSISTPWVIVQTGAVDVVQLGIAYGALALAGVPLEVEVVAAVMVWMAFVGRGELKSAVLGARPIRRSPGAVRAPGPPRVDDGRDEVAAG